MTWHPQPWFLAAVPALMALLATLNLSVPYFALMPGRPFDVNEMIKISGVRTTEPTGKLYLTTVDVRDLSACGPDLWIFKRGCLTLGSALVGWIDPSVDVVERERIIGKDETDEEVDRRNTEDMRQSQLLAGAAAMSLLGFQVQSPRGIVVTKVTPGMPAARVLRPGDIIIEADNRLLCGEGELGRVVDGHGIGGTVLLRIVRGGRASDHRLRIAEDPQERGDPAIGVTVSAPEGEVRLPVKLEIDDKDIGGPSAGLMFAVGIYDRLSSDDLAQGRSIAGTGTISAEGCVGPIGGLPQKLAGAQAAGVGTFLVPREELEDACDHRGEMTVYGVRTLEEAVSALRGRPPSGSRCA